MTKISHISRGVTTKGVTTKAFTVSTFDLVKILKIIILLITNKNNIKIIFNKS